MATTSVYFGTRPRLGPAGGLLAIAAVAALLTPAGAAWPPDEKLGTVDYSDPANWPNDPGYAREWAAWSFAPVTNGKLNQRTRQLGTGSHSDRAWARTVGDPRVVIAVLDSG